MTQNPAITVALVNYNTSDRLASCLGAVRTAVSLPHDVTVVDNASSDGGMARVASEHPWVRVILNPDNRFYPPAANQAWRAGQGDAVLFLGTDVLVKPGTVERMYEVLASDPAYGAVGCRLVDHDGHAEPGARAGLTPAVYWFNFTFLGRLLGSRRSAINAHQEYRGWDRRSDRDVGSCAGSCLMVRRSLLERFDGYDERYKLYFLEDDLCLKIRGAGLKVRFLGTVDNVHEGHVSVQRQPPAHIRTIFRNDARTYARVHFNPLTSAAIVTAMAVTGGVRRIQELLAKVGIARTPRGWWEHDANASPEAGGRS